jgi:hypothetical protein
MLRLLAVIALVACGSVPEPEATSTAPGGGESARVATPPTAPEVACVAPVSAKIENGACDRDTDCVLTELPADCGACNLERVYPTRKIAFDERMARCAGFSPPTTACGSACPEHDTYTRAFYRPECRSHRCIAWRYHSGG